jgi:hypothetical protein
MLLGKKLKIKKSRGLLDHISDHLNKPLKYCHRQVRRNFHAKLSQFDNLKRIYTEVIELKNDKKIEGSVAMAIHNHFLLPLELSE